MKKTIVAIALIVLIAGFFVAFSMPIQYDEEVVVYDWNPIKPQTLEPKTENTSKTGIAFIAITKTQDVIRKFPSLKNVTALELNVTASQPVRVTVGTVITLDDYTYTFDNVVFNDSSKFFNNRIPVKDTKADFLEIRNEGNTPVHITGNVKVFGEVVKTKYPYLSVGTLVVLTGLAILVYGTAAKPKRRIKNFRLGFSRLVT
ncbi:MAG: hypothetical protein QXK93_03040 [Candidatus Bathyarchaeia archaeon]|nr:hypothetical protein [Candidatus Bathyarchaeota archaeon]